MGSYQQFGARLWAYGGRDHYRGSPTGRILLTAAFMAAICLIAIVIGAASVQYP
jgi:hypothetical protein